jgi:hypothetical protein
VGIASQMVDERQLYLVDAESNKEYWVSEGSIRRRWVEKASESPSSNQKIVRGGPWGGSVMGGEASAKREKERRAWSARGMGETKK